MVRFDWISYDNRSIHDEFLYSIKHILNSLYDNFATIVAKRYRLYLKGEEGRRRHLEWMQRVIASILWLVKLIYNSLEQVGLKNKRITEKVTVE